MSRNYSKGSSAALVKLGFPGSALQSLRPAASEAAGAAGGAAKSVWDKVPKIDLSGIDPFAKMQLLGGAAGVGAGAAAGAIADDDPLRGAVTGGALGALPSLARSSVGRQLTEFVNPAERGVLRGKLNQKATQALEHNKSNILGKGALPGLVVGGGYGGINRLNDYAMDRGREGEVKEKSKELYKEVKNEEDPTAKLNDFGASHRGWQTAGEAFGGATTGGGLAHMLAALSGGGGKTQGIAAGLGALTGGVYAGRRGYEHGSADVNAIKQNVRDRLQNRNEG